MKRRKFINISALATGSVLVPQFLKAFESKRIIDSLNAERNENILVVIQLGGGNDGLNTLVPYRNDIYYKARPHIALPKENILKVNDELGFNNAMAGMHSIFNDGNMCVINNVGYPNPDHSHFRAMDIWQTASGSNQLVSTGWIGRYLDSSCENYSKPHLAVEVDDTLSLALKGEKINGFAMRNERQIDTISHSGFLKKALASHAQTDNENVAYLYKTMSETFSSTAYLSNRIKSIQSSADYPDNEFAKDLKTISTLIKAGSETKVYYASHSGFDTHTQQQLTQARHLKIIGDGLKSFTDDLQKSGRFNDVLILVFSEFGRRVSENASFGTDHGTANNIFIISGGLRKKGIYNEMPDLEKLDEGDLKFTVDFRSIYSTLLSKWLKANSTAILGGSFSTMDFI